MPASESAIFAGSMIVSLNPFTGARLGEFQSHSEAEISRRLDLALRTFREWHTVSFADHAEKMLRAAEILEAEKSRFAPLMTAEMGRTIGAPEAEAAKCAWVCRYYAETAAATLANWMSSEFASASISKLSG